MNISDMNISDMSIGNIKLRSDKHILILNINLFSQ